MKLSAQLMEREFSRIDKAKKAGHGDGVVEPASVAGSLNQLHYTTQKNQQTSKKVEQASCQVEATQLNLEKASVQH